MTVKQLSEKLGLEPLVAVEPEREVTGGYTGDLLSWVMGRAESGNAWVTIMTNKNIVAVATLTDVATIILAEGVRPEEDVMEAAREHGINIYGSQTDGFALCGQISQLI